MRPLTLRMTAFGPYKETELIDFTKLGEHDLFVISGNTGSGKTTIFDAICFALYGSASGEDRENPQMLRSDFADDDTHTAVEFEFSLRGKTYRLLRQIGHIKEGNVTRTGDRYEFFEQTEEGEIPCVDRQMVTEINQKVEELIGLTQNQFKQIVMLPQGEFRRLLTSETANKEEILRRLFKTEPYQQLTEKLRERRNELKEQFQQEEQQLNHYIQAIQTSLPDREEGKIFQQLKEEHFNPIQVIEGLEKEEKYYEQKIKEDDRKQRKAYAEHEKKQEAYHKAQRIHELFTDVETKEKQKKRLVEQAPLYQEKEVQLKMAEQARQIEPYEQQKVSWQEEVGKRKELMRQVKVEEATAQEHLTEMQEIYEKEKNNEEKREEVSNKLAQLKRFLPTVEEIDKQRERLEIQAKKVQSLTEEVTNLEEEYKEKKATEEDYETKINTLQKKSDQLPEKREQLLSLQEKQRQVKRYVDLIQARESLEKDLQLEKRTFEAQKEQYETIEQHYFNHQASLLADQLHDGEPCPVCGSIEHPEKATAKEDLVSREQLGREKEHLSQKEEAYRNIQVKYDANLQQLEDQRKEIEKQNIQPEQAKEIFPKINAEKKAVETQVASLEKARKQLTKIQEEYKQVKEALGKIENQIENQKEFLQKEQGTFIEMKADFKASLREIPENVQVLSILKRKIEETEIEKETLEKAWEKAQQDVQKAKNEQTRAITELKNAQKQLEETMVKEKQAKEQFEKALKEANFSSTEVYHKAKLTIEEQQQLQEEIETYKQQRSTLKKQIKELKERLKGEEKIDLEKLKEEVKQLRIVYEQALQALNASKNYYRETIQLKKNISQTYERVKTYEEQVAIVEDLFATVQGHNPKRISFERYLQIEYLEQIIRAANERLKDLSNGQFLLVRSDRTESHGRQSGLSLDVYDAYTGQMRDVKTLSGGEKFNASLCLALGMSDVIQSFQGGISIEMMFIDEGFGSLDEESLHKAIDALVDLQQSGRMIGIISHVKELKSIFPAVLEVEKTNEGHSRTNFRIE